MSPDETYSLIARTFDAFNARDIEGQLACVDEDVAHDVNQAGRRIGREAFKAYLIHRARCYRETASDLVIMVAEDGLHAAAEFTLHGTYLATDEGQLEANGQTYVLPAGIFFEVEDGLITRLTAYANQANWIAQVRARP